MKIAAAQVQSIKGNIEENIGKHIQFVKLAAHWKVDTVFFPELSLTGYEPALAKQAAIIPGDERLTVLQSLSTENKMVIGIGVPTKSIAGIHISMVVFQPGMSLKVYSKQHLHEDELPYFIPGNEQLYITVQHRKVAVAICYESLLPQHAEAVSRAGIDLYFASVAKSATGVAKAYQHYPAIAKAYSIPVMMANCVGYCDNFQSAGSSGIWNKEGKLAGRLDERGEGLLIFDTGKEEVSVIQPSGGR